MPIKVTYKFSIKEVTNAVTGAMANRMKAVGQHMEKRVKANISTAFPPASEPGQYPHMRTGDLRDAISYEAHADAVRIGVATAADCSYAKWLEIGTSKMAPRPFLRMSLDTEVQRIAKMIGAPIKGGVAVNLP